MLPVEPARTSSSPIPPEASPYWQFYDQVATQQVAAWLTQGPGRVVDLSGADGLVQQLVDAGHEVVSVRADGRWPVLEPAPGRVLAVRADVRDLSWLQDTSADLLLAASGEISTCLALEVMVEQVHRVLRPGGRLLVVVDSLALGLARLADQGRWAELADIPQADVVLVPDESGVLTRCFRPEELSALLKEGGLEVDWVRPRSVLSPSTVELAIEQGGDSALRSLVRTELQLARQREGQSGLHLVASARRPR